MQGFEENEVSLKSQGGTEITKRSIAKLIPEELSKEFQIIPSRVRDIDEDKIRVYWAHDLALDPEVSHLKEVNSRNRFHKFVFSSNWQLQDYVTHLNFPRADNVQVIETPLEPFEIHSKDFSNEIRLVYFSTPQRGLALLVPTFEALCEKYDNIHLDVFSSFKIYGWEESDKQFEPLYDAIRKHPKMTYHGFATQDVLRDHLKKAHILAYPSIWTETSCRVLIESMSAGLLCVHPNLGALADTSGGMTSMYQYCDDHRMHVNTFYQYLDHAIQTVPKEQAQNFLRFQKAYADSRFDISKIASIWEYTLKNLLEKYPTAESRKAVEEMFVYRGGQ